MITRVFSRSCAAGAIFCLSASVIPTVVHAQDARMLMGMFGGMIGAAMQQQAREQWSRLPPAEASCLQQGLSRHGISFSAVLRAGITPGDARIAGIRSLCQELSAKSLKENVECPIEGSKGEFESWCDEKFAIRSPQGSILAVSQQDAVASAFTDHRATTALFEREDAKNRRLEMIAAGIDSGPVLAPNFDCAKAHTSSAIAICNSYKLSKWDGEYGRLYKRARRFDQRGNVRKAALSFYHQATACDGSRDCLSKLQDSEIEYMADVLRKHGERVVTYIDIERTEKGIKDAADDAHRAHEEKLKRARETAKSLLTDSSDFLKWKPSDPNMLAIAEAIASLNADLKAANPDPDKIEVDNNGLSKIVHEDPNFAKYREWLAGNIRAANARHLAETIGRAQRQKEFLQSMIAESPTSDLAAISIGEVKRLDEALAASAPDLSRLQALTDEVDALLRSYNLEQRYLAYLPNVQPGATHSPTGTVIGLTRTPETRFIIDGALKDIILLYNSSPRSPHIVHNLRGNLVFNDGTGRACFYQQEADRGLLESLRSALAIYKLAKLAISSSECNAGKILGFDVIAFRRGDFLKNPRQYALELITQVQDGNFKKLATISAKSIEDGKRVIAAKQRTLAEDIEHGAISGYGIVLIDSVASSHVCVVWENHQEVHEQILKNLSDHLLAALGAKPIFQDDSSAEQAYESVERQQCGAVYASAKDLATLLPALKRGETNFHLDENWISPDKIKRVAADLENNHTKATKDALGDKHKCEVAAEIAAEQASKAANNAATQQRALRIKYGKIADAIASEIAADLKCVTDANCKSQTEEEEFPNFAAWYRKKFNDDWKMMSFNSDTSDYGTVEWTGTAGGNSRELRAGFTRVEIRMSSQIRGAYQPACFIAGRIIDDEFHTTRDPIIVPCDKAQSIEDWKSAHNFTSEWIAKVPQLTSPAHLKNCGSDGH